MKSILTLMVLFILIAFVFLVGCDSEPTEPELVRTDIKFIKDANYFSAYDGYEVCEINKKNEVSIKCLKKAMGIESIAEIARGVDEYLKEQKSCARRTKKYVTCKEDDLVEIGPEMDCLDWEYEKGECFVVLTRKFHEVWKGPYDKDEKIRKGSYQKSKTDVSILEKAGCGKGCK